MTKDKTSVPLEFSEFTKFDENQWLEKILKDLRGAALSTIDFEIQPGWTISPAIQKSAADWIPLEFPRFFRMGRLFHIDTPTEANQDLIRNLMNGINAPVLILQREFSEKELLAIFDQVDLSALSTTIISSGPNEGLTSFLKQLPDTTDMQLGFLEESAGDDFLSKFNNVQSFNLDVQEKDQPLDQLVEVLTQLDDFFKWYDYKPRVEDINKIWVSISIDNNFLVSLAKIRAVKILFDLYCNAYSMKTAPLNIQVNVKPDALLEEAEMNMIRGMSWALAARLGGAKQLNLPLAGDDEQRNNFFERISANTFHLLELEGKTAELLDPIAGASFLEELTDVLGQKAWEEFQKK